jgi:hypothetical protein
MGKAEQQHFLRRSEEQLEIANSPYRLAIDVFGLIDCGYLDLKKILEIEGRGLSTDELAGLLDEIAYWRHEIAMLSRRIIEGPVDA